MSENGSSSKAQFTGKDIGNKNRRSIQFQKFKKNVDKDRREMRRVRRKEEKADPEKKEKRLTENVPKTIDSMREFDETVVNEDDEEVAEEEGMDEYAEYFDKSVVPKILITTNKNPHPSIFHFTNELADTIPNSEFVKRGGQFEIAHIVHFAMKRGFTDVAVVTEDRKEPHTLALIHLPYGPTAYFKISNVRLGKQIHGHGRSSAHLPELILNNFSTRLGHVIGRMLHALFPPIPEFEGRQVVTFHNQRDFIFFRRHRYAFESKDKANLQEIGPRFTLKLKWLQKGLYDPDGGVFEWKYKNGMDTSRRRFFL